MRFLTTISLIIGSLVFSACAPKAPLEILYEVPPFELLDHEGQTTTLEDLKGRPWVAATFFSRCTSICPLLTTRMKELGPKLPEGVRRVSISVDPAFDQPARLAAYRKSQDIGPQADWLFLTGDLEEIKSLVIQGFKLPMSTSEDADLPPGEAILHSDRLALVDKEGNIRGYYPAFVPEALIQLAKDASTL